MDNIKTYSIPIKNFTFEQSNSNPQFLKTKYYAISEGENLNKSDFYLSSIQECLSTEDYAHKPILGAWDKTKISPNGIGGFGGHDSGIAIDFNNGEEYDTYLGENNERPLGLILPNSGKIETYKGKQWLTFEGYIWVKYSREAVNFLKKKRTNNVSVEISVIESDMVGEIEKIKKFSLLGITIIGVNAGIPNACVNILEFVKTPKYNSFVRAFASEANSDTDIAENFAKEWGVGEPLELDLSKKSASEDSWGDISKTELRNNLLGAKNYKTLIPKSYLVAEEGWEDAPSEKLKYPFVQIKSGKVVININSVQVAGAYLMKEKDRAYFKTARAKLNKIRTILGMDKLFGVESDDDWGEIISKVQPKIIKMEDKMTKKEIVSALSALFAEKTKLEEAKVKLNQAYEDKLGEYSFAEDEAKDPLKLEVDSAKELADENEKNLDETSKKIEQMAAELIKLEEEEEKCEPQEFKEDDSTECAEQLKLACTDFGATYISNSKEYVVYAKEDGVFACKFKVVDGVAKLVEDEVKSDKVFVTIPTGGTISVDDTMRLPPMLVEITNGVASELVKASKIIVEKERTIKEKETVIKEMSDKSDLYKKSIAEYIAKFDELTEQEDITKEYKDSIRDKIYNMEFKNLEDMQTKVQSHLYTIVKPKIMGGLFTKHPKQNESESSEDKLIQELIKKNKKTR